MLALTVNLAEIHTGLSRRYFQLYLLSRSIDTSISGNPAISSVSVSVSPRSLLLPRCLLLHGNRKEQKLLWKQENWKQPVGWFTFQWIFQFFSGFIFDWLNLLKWKG